MHTALLHRDQSNRSIFIVAAHTHKKDVSNTKSDAAPEWVAGKKIESRARQEKTHHNRLQHTATHNNKLQHIFIHMSHAVLCPLTDRNTLQHAASQCSTLQHTATHYNILQYTATHVLWQGMLRLSVQMQHTVAHCNYLSKQCPQKKEGSLHCNTSKHKRRDSPISMFVYTSMMHPSWIKKFLDLFIHIYDASSKCSWISCGSLDCIADWMSPIFFGPFLWMGVLLQCVAVFYCSELHYFTVYCSALQCVYSVLQRI